MLQESLPAFTSVKADVFRLVYKELHEIAFSQMSRESVFSTLQATALVHEAWLRMGADNQPEWKSRAYFFTAAAESMRRILVDRARKAARLRHGGEIRRVAIEDFDALHSRLDGNDQILLIDEALEAFAVQDPLKAQLVELRYFIGLSFEETARTLGVSESTAKRWWAYSRSWLYRYMGSGVPCCDKQT